MHKSKVVEYFGSVQGVADALSISHSSVSQWGEVIPEKQAFRLEEATNGKLKRNPSLYKKA